MQLGKGPWRLAGNSSSVRRIMVQWGNCIRGSLDSAAAAMPVTVTGLSSCAVTAKAGD